MSFKSGTNVIIDSNKDLKYPTTIIADGLSSFSFRSVTGSIFEGTNGEGCVVNDNGIDAVKDGAGVVSLGKSASPSNDTFIAFRVNGSNVGRIHASGTTLVYATSSDYRIKENVTSLTSQWENIKTLNPVTFTSKNSKNPTEIFSGFIAHEVANTYSDIVNGEKDAVDEYGKPKYQSVDYSKLTPQITKGLQESISRIETLQSNFSNIFNRIEKLENT